MMSYAIEPEKMYRAHTELSHRLKSTFLAILLALAGAIALAAPATAGCDDDDRPPAPISLKAVPIGSGGITLQWSSNVGHYDIYISDERGRPVPEAPNIVGGATNENYHDFLGLQPDKAYFFSMRARSEGGTQGCVSKNASETVSARTDTADLNNICSKYALTAMDNVKEMQSKQCQFPSGPIIGRWATSERTHFLYCLEQRRAGLQGDAKAQWLRNQDLVACKAQADQCRKYRAAAGNASLMNTYLGCGYTGERWVFNGAFHYSWCMGLSDADSYLPARETRRRREQLDLCRAKKASTAQTGGGGGGGGGGDTKCAGVPAEWEGMLNAHNNERAKYCGASLTWSCDLAKGAKEYADKCILDTHGNPPGIGENMADWEAVPDKFPAADDDQTYEAVWGCERDEFHFDAPELVFGFKKNCHEGQNGQKPVNGHFTQVVWRATKELGCARARCTMKDDKGVEHKLTHWVCRYGPGGNDPGALALNVQQPPCVNAFHSLTVPACSAGMVMKETGSCDCPAGENWNGRMCVSGKPVAKPVTMAPVGGGGKEPARPSREMLRCPSNRPIGDYPNCCPAGTVFRNGMCWSPSGGATPSKSAGDNPRRPPDSPQCPQSRPVGIYPNCCPSGTVFANNACQASRKVPGEVSGGGTNSSRRISTKTCPNGKTVLQFMRCPDDTARSRTCPSGYRVLDRPNKYGAYCEIIRKQTSPAQTTPAAQQLPTPAPAPKPTKAAPRPAPPDCTGGKVNRSLDGVCVCPAGTTERNGQCVDAVR